MGIGSTTSRWALADHEGSVRDVLNNSAAVVDHIVYDSFGNITSQTNASELTRATYTGAPTDAETGFIYLHNRYMDPSTGRFIGQDPIAFAAGDSNLYRYVSNDPLGATDPSGLDKSRGKPKMPPPRGMQWQKNPATGQWELVPAPAQSDSRDNQHHQSTAQHIVNNLMDGMNRGIGTQQDAANLYQAMLEAGYTPLQAARWLQLYNQQFLEHGQQTVSDSAESWMRGLTNRAIGAINGLAHTAVTHPYGFYLPFSEDAWKKLVPSGQIISPLDNSPSLGEDPYNHYFSGAVGGMTLDVSIAAVQIGEIAGLRWVEPLPPTPRGFPVEPIPEATAIPEAEVGPELLGRDGVDAGEVVGEGPYSHLKDPPSAGPGKEFTPSQKAEIYRENMAKNDGVLRSDLDGQELVMPKRSMKGVTPPSNEAQVDHMQSRVPADPGAPPGTNSYSNARVLSRQQNRTKSNN